MGERELLKIDHEARTVTFRQSWLGDARVCPERGRLAVVKPEWNQLDSDAALVGTAAHHEIEQALNGRPVTPGDTAYCWAKENIDPERVRWVKHESVEEIASLAHDLAMVWHSDIAPLVPAGGKTEVPFEGDVFEWGGYVVRIQGTVDYVSPTGLWDWKTSGWEYKPWEKQRWDIQSTVYLYAASRGFLGDVLPLDTPFRFGVMYKPRSKSGKCSSDVVTVSRTQADVDWMFRQMRTYVDLALATDMAISWPLIDNENNLCSDRWCPWWSTCKGAHVSEANYATANQSIPKPAVSAARS